MSARRRAPPDQIRAGLVGGAWHVGCVLDPMILFAPRKQLPTRPATVAWPAGWNEAQLQLPAGTRGVCCGLPVVV